MGNVTRGGRLALPWLVLLSTASAEAGPLGWAQMGGSPDHSGWGDLPAGPLDVLGQFEALPNAELGYHTAPVTVAGGLALDFLDSDSQRCGFLFFDDASEARGARNVTMPCLQGSRPDLFAHDALSNLLFLCHAGMPSEPFLVARDAESTRVAWSLTPADLGILDTGDAPATLWHCTAGAVDATAREVVVGLHQGSSGRGWVASVRADDGRVNWARATHGSAPAGQGDFLPADAERTLDPARDQGFEADEVTITHAGIAVGGDIADQVQAVVWMDRQGNINGGSSPDVGGDRPGADLGPARSRSGAWVGNGGDLAAIVMDRRLIVVNPSLPSPLKELTIDIQEPLTEANLFPWPAWWSSYLLTPLTHSVHAFQGTDFRPAWTWYPGPAWRISSLLIAPPGDAYVLATQAAAQGHDAYLWRLDLVSGEAVQRLPLPIGPAVRSSTIEGVSVTRWFADLVPSPAGGLLVVDRQGQMVRLGRAPDGLAPRVEIATEYPRLREDVVVRPTAAWGTTPLRFLVNFGSGPVQELDPGGSARFQYATTGLRTVRVTAVFGDGRTATAERTLDVGGTPPTPPADRTFLEQAFARQNQDLTFGILGIAIALGGGVAAYARMRTRRYRLRHEVAAIEHSAAALSDDAERAEAVLADHRSRIRTMALTGKLDHAEANLLERRLDEFVRQARLDALETRFPFLTVGMARALKGMLADTRISSPERQTVLETLERDADLTEDQKGRLRRQVEAWFDADRREAPGSRKTQAV